MAWAQDRAKGLGVSQRRKCQQRLLNPGDINVSKSLSLSLSHTHIHSLVGLSGFPTLSPGPAMSLAFPRPPAAPESGVSDTVAPGQEQLLLHLPVAATRLNIT